MCNQNNNTDDALSFRKICSLKGGGSDYLVLLFDILSPVDFPQKYWLDKSFSVDWDKLFLIATDTFTAPLLYKRIIEQELEKQVPDDFFKSLEAVYELNKQRNVQLKSILVEAIKVLNNGGIKPTLLKGANALFGLLPNEDSRMMGDLDLLIPKGQLILARDLLFEEGYYHDHKGVLKTDDISAIQSGHSHIAPLFHSSGYGYIELHRYPNYEPNHPCLIKYCFDEVNCSSVNIEGCLFHASTKENLFLYNQVHHYYSVLEKVKYPDVRYLVEQCFLLEELKSSGLDKIHSVIKERDKSFDSAFLLQNALIADLLQYPVDAQYRVADLKNKKHLNELKKLLMFDKSSIRRLKISILKDLVFSKKGINLSWVKYRVFNIKYYFFIVKRFYRVMRDGR